LRGLLLRAARFEIDRRHPEVADLETSDELVRDAAASALSAVLGDLDQFRQQSRFTTWASKFALAEAAVQSRRRAWAATNSSGGWTIDDLDPALRRAIQDQLDPKERQVLLAVALDNVPLDVVADRLGSTRGALYQSIHDARTKLRTALAESSAGIADNLESVRQ
jgi:RNA polymerase sigma-70 factor (ECF subfamily)